MDLTPTIQAKSDQQNYDDYLAGPRTVTIEKVTAGNNEQPVNIHLVEYPGRPYKPSKSMRRVIVAAWGPQATDYVGRRMTLYGDPTVKFGGIAVGGIKISHLSHIDKPITLPLTISKGKRATHTVEPLPDAPVSPAQAAPSTPPSVPPADEAAADQPTPEQIAASTSEKELRAWWETGTPEIRAQINARVNELRAQAGDGQ